MASEPHICAQIDVKQFSYEVLQPMVFEVHLYEQELEMQAFVVGATLAGSMATAFVLQRALLEAWLRAMQHQGVERRSEGKAPRAR